MDRMRRAMGENSIEWSMIVVCESMRESINPSIDSSMDSATLPFSRVCNKPSKQQKSNKEAHRRSAELQKASALRV